MKRFHIALAVADLDASIEDYSRRLEKSPMVVVPGKYAMWRTESLNFSISQIPEHAGELRHLGFEDAAASGFSSTTDVNGIDWEHFSPEAQDQKIIAIYGDGKAGTRTE